ncbi:MAG TPA: hypothetical protein VJT74_13615, partial [Pyrinomonadaceae bacterium]|nr:hypothetical protein [Pyrinomonadaceae bacterium]
GRFRFFGGPPGTIFSSIVPISVLFSAALIFWKPSRPVPGFLEYSFHYVFIVSTGVFSFPVRHSR